MSTDEQYRIGQGRPAVSTQPSNAIDFAWESRATNRTLHFRTYTNTVALLRYLDDEGYPNASPEYYANDPDDHFVVLAGNEHITFERRQLVQELRGIDSGILATLVRLGRLDPDGGEDRRAVRDVTTMFDQIRESIHNKIRDYDGTP